MKARPVGRIAFWTTGLASLVLIAHELFQISLDPIEANPNRVSIHVSDYVMVYVVIVIILGGPFIGTALLSAIHVLLTKRLCSFWSFFHDTVIGTAYFFFLFAFFLAIQFTLDWLPLELWQGLNSAFCEGDTRCMPGWVGDHFWWKCFLIALIPYAAWVVWSARLTIASPQRPARSKTTNRIGLVFVALVSLSPVCGFIALSYAMGYPPPGPAMPPDIPRFIDRIETI